MNFLIEATGSLTSGYLINAIKQAGHKVIGSDISDFNHAKILCDDFIIMPKSTDKNLWSKTINLLKRFKIDIVIPSFDESLLDWSKVKNDLRVQDIHVIISDYNTIKICQDKWETYEFFKYLKIPTPKTSLQDEFEIIKPRLGRGGKGIFTNDYKKKFSMEGMISQEKIYGLEYTVDVFFLIDGRPLYIVPRKRIDVYDGKSTKGIVIKNSRIEKLIIKMSKELKFIGPINFQLFETENNELFFIEINPRIAGGMALGFEATENWIDLIIDNIINRKKVQPKSIRYGLKMVRYYNECFFE